MKTNNIFRFAAMFFAAVSMVCAVSCEDPMPEPGPDGGDEPEQVAAAFPDLVEDYEVAPGSKLTLTFTPNYDWEVSLPSEVFKYFWIVDGAFKVEKLSGSASTTPVTVTIGVSKEEEFDNNRSCDITMTMNGESKVIAKYMRPAKNRTLSVYSAQLDSDGNLAVGEDGESYVYGTAEAETAALVWSAATADFRLPVKVEANCEWDIDVPEWLSVEKPEKTTGVVELVLTGVSFEEATGKIAFKVGETVLKEIEVTIPSCKGVEVYTATMTDGEFEYGESGKYVWSEAAATEVTLAWLGSDFRMPVKISSKCDWDLVLPEWLDVELPEKVAGVLELVLKGIPSKYPLEDTEAKVKFMFGDKLLYELVVKIPGCEDIMSYSIDMSLTELNYNALGWIETTSDYVDIDAAASIYGTKDVRVFAVETTGGVVGSAPEWFEVKVGNYVTAAGSDVLQERDVVFKIEENKGDEERSAVVFFLPPSVEVGPSELFNQDATVKSEYVKYSVPVHQMSSDYDEYLEFSSADEGTEYTFVAADQTKKASLVSQFGETDHVYVLTYNAKYSRIFVNMAVPFASYKVFSADDMTSDKSEDEAFWLQLGFVNETYTYGAFTMYNGMELPVSASTGYVVFYDKNGNVLAIVECVSPVKEEEVVTPPEGENYITDQDGNKYFEDNSYFADPDAAAAAGAKMYQYVAGPIYDNSSDEVENGTKLMKLVLPGSGVSVALNVQETYAYYQMPYALSSYITVNGEQYGETQGLTSAKTNATISMVEIPSTSKDTPMVKFHTSMGVANPFLAVYLFLE